MSNSACLTPCAAGHGGEMARKDVVLFADGHTAPSRPYENVFGNLYGLLRFGIQLL